MYSASSLVEETFFTPTQLTYMYMHLFIGNCTHEHTVIFVRTRVHVHTSMHAIVQIMRRKICPRGYDGGKA